MKMNQNKVYIVYAWVNWFPEKLIYQRRLINRVAPVYRKRLQRWIEEDMYWTDE